MADKYLKNTNPVKHQKSLDNLTRFFKGFNKLFDDKKIDEIVNREFPQQYPLLPLLVKARIYYDKQ